MKKLITAIATTLILIGSATGAYFYIQSTKPVQSNESVFIYNFKEAKAYIQNPVDSKVINGEKIKMFWIKVIEKDGAFQQNRVEMNCSSKMVRGVQYANYDKNAELLDASSYADTEWQTVVPQTNFNLVLNYVCK